MLLNLHIVVKCVQIHTNMCLTFGTAGLLKLNLVEHIAYSLYIVINTVSLMLFAGSYCLIFYIIVQSNKNIKRDPSSRASKSQNLMIISIRFISLIAITFVCWIPIITALTLGLCGVQLPDSIIIWIVVIFVPVNATANPCIHSLRLSKKSHV